MFTNHAWTVRSQGEPADVLRYEERALPPLGPRQLRVAVRAAALALPDVFMCRGFYPLTPALPFTPGQEACGVVVEAGADATTPLGARVMAFTDFVHGNGGLGEHTIVDEDNAFAVPESMSDVEAGGFLIAYMTAWIGLVQRAAVVASDVVLVLGGAGGTGSGAVQLAHALGANVIAVANGAERTQRCRQLGADHVIDRSSQDLGAAVRELTAGRGVDVVYDPVGGDAGTTALRCMASEGRFLAIGFAGGSWPSVDVARLVVGNATVMGVYPGKYDRPARVAMVDALVELVGRGALVPAVTAVGFADVPSALTAVANGATFGRPVALATS